MTQLPDERAAEMRELFFETAQELLQSLNDEALKLEKHPADEELVRSIRRIVHTLKGDAAACGFRELSNAAHELEDALALESAASHDSLAEISFTAADIFNAMLTAYRHKGKLPSAAPLAKLVRELTEPLKGKKRSKKTVAGKGKVAVAPAAWTEYEKLAIQNAVARGKSVYHITAGIDSHCAMPIAARQLVLNGLAPCAEVLGVRPEAGSPASTQRVELLVATEKSADQLSARCRIPTVISSVAVELVKAGEIKVKQAAPAEATTAEATTVETTSPLPYPASSPVPVDEYSSAARHSHPVLAENILRVDAERIDSVLNLVGELIIGRSMLQQAFTEFARHAPKEALRGRFSDAMAFQSRVLSDLQRSVMKIRMVPVEQLFRRFPRMVRDVAKQCGKDVALELSGQDTDLDKSLMDAIAEPLTHLVRNAVSHGIENAEERVRNGKPAARNHSPHVVSSRQSSDRRNYG